MDKTTLPSRHDPPAFLRKAGFWAVLLGAVALALVFIGIVGPTLDPAPSAATQVGEIAGEIKRAAWRSFFGLAPKEPVVEAVPVFAYVALAAPILGILAIVLAVVSGVRGENWRYPVYATGLGTAAIVFHYFWWLALLVAGVMLLVAVLENIGDIFSF